MPNPAVQESMVEALTCLNFYGWHYNVYDCFLFVTSLSKESKESDGAHTVVAILEPNFAYENVIFKTFWFCLASDQTRDLFFCHTHPLSHSGFVILTSATDTEAGSAGIRGTGINLP